MSQEDWIVLALKIASAGTLVTVAAWITLYTCYAKWWRNPIGRSLIYFALLNAGEALVFILSLFFHFNRLTSLVAGWVFVTLMGLGVPVMVSRIVVWHRLHKSGTDL